MCFVLVSEYKQSGRRSGCLSKHNVTAAQWLKGVNYAAWHGAKPIPDFSSSRYANHALNCVLFSWFTKYTPLCFHTVDIEYVNPVHVNACIR